MIWYRFDMISHGFHMTPYCFLYDFAWLLYDYDDNYYHYYHYHHYYHYYDYEQRSHEIAAPDLEINIFGSKYIRKNWKQSKLAMILHVLYMILYVFHMILYDFYMILYCFYMIFGCVAEIFGWPVFLNFNVYTDFERSTGNSKYHRNFRMTRFSEF